ncbi:hypothetical protein KSP40_PGU014022 [Platanthera guangdongensis]|uniref:CDT1 Geminin-binding domain-containing protein n=1 Tax=Platanthera guangdongensis TaxID=2320717 RepID=A0ABR2LNJ0_9ASPA
MESPFPSPSDLFGAAEKLPPASPRRTKDSSSTASVSDEIPTPEKQVQLPRQTGKRRLSFSVNDVRRIAMRLRRTRSEAANHQDLPGFDDELQRKSESGSDSVPMSSTSRNIVKLPENHEMLAEFFNCLDSSIRLLRLKGASSTFANISASIQNLTERRFTYKHLAQLKHILPESISIKKVLLRDEATSCMKPELLVSLRVDAMERKLELKGESAYSALRKSFRSRLVQFAREHPEEDEIPEEILPHPFGHTKHSMATESSESIPSVLVVPSTAVSQVEKLTTVSHFAGSFKRRFSQRIPCSDEMKSPILSLSGNVSKADSLVSNFPSTSKFSSKLSIHKKSPLSSSGKVPLKMDHQKMEEDSKMLITSYISPSKGIISSESTPVKEISTPKRLMSSTPELQMPKRSCEGKNDDTPQKEVVKRGARTRLFPTPKKNVKFDGAESFSKHSLIVDDLGFLPESLLQDIKEKERIAIEERETNAAGSRSRKKMIANLPRLLNSILLIFQTGNRSVITKQELVHKILSSHCSVIDRIEVEEQLELMQELAPDWISQKKSLTGDILYR